VQSNDCTGAAALGQAEDPSKPMGPLSIHTLSPPLTTGLSRESMNSNIWYFLNIKIQIHMFK